MFLLACIITSTTSSASSPSSQLLTLRRLPGSTGSFVLQMFRVPRVSATSAATLRSRRGMYKPVQKGRGRLHHAGALVPVPPPSRTTLRWCLSGGGETRCLSHGKTRTTSPPWRRWPLLRRCDAVRGSSAPRDPDSFAFWTPRWYSILWRKGGLTANGSTGLQAG